MRIKTPSIIYRSGGIIMMGRPRLSKTEREHRRRQTLSRSIKRQKLKMEAGFCRDCDEKLSKSSSIFCDYHLEKHRQNCKKANEKFQITRYQQIKQKAKQRNIHFDLIKEKFNEWFNQPNKKCFYCGVEEEKLTDRKDKKKRGMTIDRKDNSIGYTIDNICLSCFRCNNSKSNFFTAVEWQEICNRYVKPRLDEYQGL